MELKEKINMIFSERFGGGADGLNRVKDKYGHEPKIYEVVFSYGARRIS